jgi:uncharacterized protein YgiM (DUF1202 family)
MISKRNGGSTVMSLKRRLLIVVWAAMLVAVGVIPAAAQTLYVNRDQVPLRAGPASYYNVVYTARRGEALTVVSRQGDWLQVRAAGGTGWVFKTALSASRSSLSSLTRSLVGTARTSQLDKTAGFKGFNQDTQNAYISRYQLGAQLQVVQQIKARQLSPQDVQRFIADGRLAR